MAQPNELTPQEAVERTLTFIERGVTGNLDQDEVAASNVKGVFGQEGQRTEQQVRKLGGLARAYLDGGAPHLARIVLYHIGSSDSGTVPESTQTRIRVFDPMLNR